MNHREQARDYFKRCNLTYEDINMNDIYKLCQILNVRIGLTNSCMIMIREPILKGKYRTVFLKNGKIKFAAIRVRGDYFEDREAITFNSNGWIGFCGWADDYNALPFVMGFKEWCDYLKSKKGDIDE